MPKHLKVDGAMFPAQVRKGRYSVATLVGLVLVWFGVVPNDVVVTEWVDKLEPVFGAVVALVSMVAARHVPAPAATPEAPKPVGVKPGAKPTVSLDTLRELLAK